MEMHTDGNQIAGMLQEVFVAEMTDTMRMCESCHHETPIGAHRLYSGAGYVLRCPNCGDLAGAIAVRPDAYSLTLRGTWTFGRTA
jgi:hypothetical protein